MDGAIYCGLASDEGRSLFTIFLLLVSATLYIMGLMESKKGHYAFLAGLTVHVASIIERTLTLGTLPLTEKHDNISYMAFVMALSYLYIHVKKESRSLSVIMLPLISLLLCVSAAHLPINTVSPFMRSYWFYLHIFLYFTAFGLFGLSFCAGAVYMHGRKSEYESMQYRTALSGWVIFTAGLVSGSIWFYSAYGTYWLWTSRELWTTLLWFYYGLYLHARLMKGFRGRTASAIGTFGLIVALFTYFGVGTIIPSPPTQF
ncbi:MAG: cytochrome c biogenesis protein CcsA [Nitrospirae bacterium]|nr:cytochrome c biogenesis protein CcsA [Nitrospirota bacterium]